jgi:hypothetical protein
MFGHSMNYYFQGGCLIVFGGESKRGVLVGGDRNPLQDLFSYSL